MRVPRPVRSLCSSAVRIPESAYRLVVAAREIAAPRPLDLEDASAVVGEVARAEGGRDGVFEREDGDAFEGSHRSEGTRQLEHVLRDVGEDEVGGDRRHLIE